jgi:hypothetical protein
MSTPLKAIRRKCIECSGNSVKNVASCDITDCDLHPYRFGKNPKRKGVGNVKNIVAVQSIHSITLATNPPTQPQGKSKQNDFRGCPPIVSEDSVGGAK